MVIVGAVNIEIVTTVLSAAPVLIGVWRILAKTEDRLGRGSTVWRPGSTNASTDSKTGSTSASTRSCWQTGPRPPPDVEPNHPQ